MNKMIHIFILFSFTSVLCQQGPDKFDDVIKIGNFFTQNKKTAICMDVDGVVIGKSLSSIFWHMKNKIPFSSIINTIWTSWSKFYKSSDGSKAPFDTNKNPINGVTYQWLHCARENQTLLPYIVEIINIIQTTRFLNTKTALILKYLKEKGHPILFLTNKDHYGYLKAEETLGAQFSSIPDHVICCEPGNTPEFMDNLHNFYKQDHIPQEAKNFLTHIKELKPSNYMHYAPWAKPRKEYWGTLKLLLHKLFQKGKIPPVIFFDDKQENVDGINKYKNKKMTGYRFTTAEQFAQQLIALEILDHDKDKELFEKL